MKEMLTNSIENPYAYRSSATAQGLKVKSRCGGYCRWIVLLIFSLVVAFSLLIHYHHQPINIGDASSGNLRRRDAVKIDPTMPRSSSETLIKTEEPEDVSGENKKINEVPQTISPTNSPTATPSFSHTTHPTMSPTTSPTASPTLLPSALPTDRPVAPTAPPTAIATAAPSIAPTAPPTAAPTNKATLPVIKLEEVAQSPAVPTAQPTSSPTADGRHMVVWMRADFGVELVDPSEADNPLKTTSAVNCWNSLNSMDRDSEDFLVALLQNKVDLTADKTAAAAPPVPIAQEDRLNYIHARFCKDKDALSTHSVEASLSTVTTAYLLKDIAIGKAIVSHPSGYTWAPYQPPSVHALAGRPQIQFKTYFFVLYLNGSPLSEPSSVKHICFFADHRSAPVPRKFCLFDKQPSLLSGALEHTSPALIANVEHSNRFVVVSYRVTPTPEGMAGEEAVEISMSGQQDFSPVPGVQLSDPGANSVLLFEESLDGKKAVDVNSYLTSKYGDVKTQAAVPLSAALMTELKRHIEDDQADPEVVPIPFAPIPKLSCAEGTDPFIQSPVDSFVVPANASVEDKKKWTDAVGLMVTEISSLSVGGAALRKTIEEKVKALQALRKDIFCPYFV